MSEYQTVYVKCDFGTQYRIWFGPDFGDLVKYVCQMNNIFVPTY